MYLKNIDTNQYVRLLIILIVIAVIIMRLVRQTSPSPQEYFKLICSESSVKGEEIGLNCLGPCVDCRQCQIEYVISMC